MRARLALCALLVACGGAGRPPSARAPSPIPAATRQLLVGVTPSWDATTAELQRWERAPGEPWRPVGPRVPAWVGAAGLGWGRGLHGEGAPSGEPGPTKAEGDRRSPAGTFRLSAAFGYGAQPPAGARLPYAQLGDGWRCVDDPSSSRYNQVFDAAGVKQEWSSAETMRRDDELYEWVVFVDHNAGRPAPGAGSCIFLHVGDGATVGCTAMARADLETIIGWLDPDAQPIYVLLPADARARLGAAWSLPGDATP